MSVTNQPYNMAVSILANSSSMDPIKKAALSPLQQETPGTLRQMPREHVDVLVQRFFDNNGEGLRSAVISGQIGDDEDFHYKHLMSTALGNLWRHHDSYEALYRVAHQATVMAINGGHVLEDLLRFGDGKVPLYDRAFVFNF